MPIITMRGEIMKKILCLIIIVSALLAGFAMLSSPSFHLQVAGGDDASSDDGGGEDTDFA